MTDASRLSVFTTNIFHRTASTHNSTIDAGVRILIEHAFGPYRELRDARIIRCEKYELAWTETKATGPDWFPHSQRLRLVEDDDGNCVIYNRIDGAFRWPGARWWLIWWYRWILAVILDAENRKIGRLSVGHSK
ncbi:MAG: hypothetical protein ACI97A_004157 [Planctomycetota bacterium]|jgi:hypothetical protein